MRNRYLVIFLVVLVITVAAILVRIVPVPYYVYSKGLVTPLKEWSLRKSGDGTLVSVQKDFLKNVTTHLAVTEFQRGDLAEFTVNRQLLQKNKVSSGDTIGVIRSIEEERRLAELSAELAVQQSLFQVYASGEKPENVQMAYESMIRAEHEYETQMKLTQRSRELYDKEFIPLEEYELSLNQYQVKKQSMIIARLNYDAVSTGEKPEQLEYIKARIHSLEVQIEQTQQILSSFHILSPMDGTLVGRRSMNNPDETVISIADLSQYLVLLPVEVHQMPYIKTGQQLVLKTGSYGGDITAEIAGIDNVVQMIDQRQNVFITALVQKDALSIAPGMVMDATIDCGKISVTEYFKRLFRIVYAN